jgi:hypothetical protein
MSQTAIVPPRTCADHPERPVHARCMSCGKTLCDECATEWDGINYCAACLSRRRQALPGSGTWASVLLLLLAAGLLVLHVQLLVTVGVFTVQIF